MLCWWLWWEAKKKEQGKAVNNPISPLLPSSLLYIILAAKGRCLRQKNSVESILLPPTLSNNICSWWEVSFLQFSCFPNKWIYTFHWLLLQVKIGRIHWFHKPSRVSAAPSKLQSNVFIEHSMWERLRWLLSLSLLVAGSIWPSCMCQSVGKEKWIYS